MRSRGGKLELGPIGQNGTAGSKNAARGTFLIGIVKETIGRGHGRAFGPVDIMVSALDIYLVEREVLRDDTHQQGLHAL